MQKNDIGQKTLETRIRTISDKIRKIRYVKQELIKQVYD